MRVVVRLTDTLTSQNHLISACSYHLPVCVKEGAPFTRQLDANVSLDCSDLSLSQFNQSLVSAASLSDRAVYILMKDGHIEVSKTENMVTFTKHPDIYIIHQLNENVFLTLKKYRVSFDMGEWPPVIRISNCTDEESSVKCSHKEIIAAANIIRLTAGFKRISAVINFAFITAAAFDGAEILADTSAVEKDENEHIYRHLLYRYEGYKTEIINNTANKRRILKIKNYSNCIQVRSRYGARYFRISAEDFKKIASNHAIVSITNGDLSDLENKVAAILRLLDEHSIERIHPLDFSRVFRPRE